MATTRSQLVAATISSVDGSVSIPCHFNPENYSITKKNHYEKKEGDVRRPPKPEFKGFGRTTLKLAKLIFDTYETGESLIAITNKLQKLMQPKDASDQESPPHEVVFAWGTLFFKAVIENMTIDFTLFDQRGMPVRASVSITFVESDDPTQFTHAQNPTSGGGPILEIRRVMSGDRLDLIANDVYGDPNDWRLIADYNGLLNPMFLRPGQRLIIPPKK